MNPIEIIPVKARRDLRRFIRLPWDIYRHDSHWVPPLISEMKGLLDKSKNPFFVHSKADFFLALKDGRCVGRIAAILNQNHNRFHGENMAFFGFFESIDDEDVSTALFDHVARWARDRGMEQLRGPVSYSTNDTCGLLVEGFDCPPSVMMAHNPDYYPGLVSAAGFEKAMDLYAWVRAASIPLSSKIVRVAEKSMGRSKIRVRSIDMKNFGREVEIIRRIYNDAWSNNWGFVPMTDAEFRHTAKSLKAIVDPRLVLIAEKNDEPVAFALTLPDINQALRKINGRLFPIGLPLLLYYARRVGRVRTLALGIVKRLQNWSGLGAALYFESYRRSIEAGYGEGELSWTLETNDLINRSMRLFEARIYKRYRIYQKTL
ncbi:MAG: N-acetyltransferase [Acidobacteria bacterium]|nr:N-acetyltransferase [Acidobacteriota bacterium]